MANTWRVIPAANTHTAWLTPSILLGLHIWPLKLLPNTPLIVGRSAAVVATTDVLVAIVVVHIEIIEIVAVYAFVAWPKIRLKRNSRRKRKEEKRPKYKWKSEKWFNLIYCSGSGAHSTSVFMREARLMCLLCQRVQSGIKTIYRWMVYVRFVSKQCLVRPGRQIEINEIDANFSIGIWWQVELVKRPLVDDQERKHGCLICVWAVSFLPAAL